MKWDNFGKIILDFQKMERKVKICAIQLNSFPSNFDPRNNFLHLFKSKMVRKALFFFINFCLLAVLFTCNNCNATAATYHKSEVKSNSESFLSFVEIPYVASCHSKCIISENSNEQDLTDSSLLPIEPLYVAFANHPDYVAIINSEKFQIKGLLERNITPAQFVSRTSNSFTSKIEFSNCCFKVPLVTKSRKLKVV